MCLEELNDTMTAITANFPNQNSREVFSEQVIIKFRSKRLLGANRVKIWKKDISDRENSMYNCSQVRKKRKRKEVREERGGKSKEQAQSSGQGWACEVSQ